MIAPLCGLSTRNKKPQADRKEQLNCSVAQKKPALSTAAGDSAETENYPFLHQSIKSDEKKSILRFSSLGIQSQATGGIDAIATQFIHLAQQVTIAGLELAMSLFI